jgi:hypothetical protein
MNYNTRYICIVHISDIATCATTKLLLDKNIGGVYHAFYIICVILLVFLLQDTLNMV